MGFLRRLLPLLALIFLAPALSARADGDEEAPVPAGYARVPDLHRLPPREAARRLARLRLTVGRVYDVAVPASWQKGVVIQQAPPPGAVLRQTFPVHIRVSAQTNGAPEGYPAPRDWPRPLAHPRPPLQPAPPVRIQPPPPPAPPPSTPGAVTPGSGTPGAVMPGSVMPGSVMPNSGTQPTEARPVVRRPAGSLPPPTVADPQASAVPPAIPVPEEPVAAHVPAALRPFTPGLTDNPHAVPPAVPEPSDGPALGTEAVGSPDAPRDAPPPDPRSVPALVGLALSDAEYRARAAEMQLYVERVAGHPVGRVLAQAPEPGASRPPAGVVRVTVAVGGDHAAELAPAPLVEVKDIAIPDLLDRTGPQAQRILGDLGLVCDTQAALRGPPGRVADQHPAAGKIVPKGTTVVVKVAPDNGPAPGPRVPSPGAAPGGHVPPVPRPGRATASAAAPQPLAPAGGTAMGADGTLTVGFTWRPVAGATAYLVEVEERGASGWTANARQVARQSAVVVEVIRLGTPPGALRWRVRAVSGGNYGKACAWVVLN